MSLVFFVCWGTKSVIFTQKHDKSKAGSVSVFGHVVPRGVHVAVNVLVSDL